MVLESDFEKEVSSRRLTDSKVVELVRTYRRRIEESGWARNTRIVKMSRINAIVKRLYPHLYAEVLSFNVPDRQEKKNQIQERNEFNMNRLENRQEFSFKEIMSDIDTLKESEDYYKLIICIMLASGRRNAEVVAGGEFSPSKLPHHVIFSGQVKSREEKRDAYDIPVIGLTPQTLIRLLEKIRGMKNYNDKSNMFIASRTNAYINRAIVRVLDKPDRHCTSETIRCIYAFIAYRLYGNPKISEPAYCSKILGHKGSPNVFVNNYNRIFVSGIKSSLDTGEEETIEVLGEELAKKDRENAFLKNEIASLKRQLNFNPKRLK